MNWWHCGPCVCVILIVEIGGEIPEVSEMPEGGNGRGRSGMGGDWRVSVGMGMQNVED